MPNIGKNPSGVVRAVRCLALLGLFAVLWTTSAHAAVTVRFANPEHFSDARSPGGTALAGIKSYLERLGRRLEPGLDLLITVLDLDLAGQDEMFRHGTTVRVLRGATPPRIKVRYVLAQGRKIIASGEELITDPMYESRIDTAGSSDPQRYEKAMLDDWFRNRFGSHLRGG